MGDIPIRPVSRQFLWKCAKAAKETGADKWVVKFWEAANAGKGEIAKNYFNIIKTVIKNNAGKVLATEMEAMLPEMGAALTGLGVEAGTVEVATVAVAEELAMGCLGYIAIAVFVGILLYYCFKPKPAHGEEPPRKLPKQFKGKNGVDPATDIQMALITKELYRNLGRTRNLRH